MKKKYILTIIMGKNDFTLKRREKIEKFFKKDIVIFILLLLLFYVIFYIIINFIFAKGYIHINPSADLIIVPLTLLTLISLFIGIIIQQFIYIDKKVVIKIMLTNYNIVYFFFLLLTIILNIFYNNFTFNKDLLNLIVICIIYLLICFLPFLIIHIIINLDLKKFIYKEMKTYISHEKGYNIYSFLEKIIQNDNKSNKSYILENMTLLRIKFITDKNNNDKNKKINFLVEYLLDESISYEKAEFFYSLIDNYNNSIKLYLDNLRRYPNIFNIINDNLQKSKEFVLKYSQEFVNINKLIQLYIEFLLYILPIEVNLTTETIQLEIENFEENKKDLTFVMLNMLGQNLNKVNRKIISKLQLFIYKIKFKNINYFKDIIMLINNIFIELYMNEKKNNLEEYIGVLIKITSKDNLFIINDLLVQILERTKSKAISYTIFSELIQNSLSYYSNEIEGVKVARINSYNKIMSNILSINSITSCINIKTINLIREYINSIEDRCLGEITNTIDKIKQLLDNII